MKNEKTPMSYTKNAFRKLGVPFTWYGSGGGYEHWVVSPRGDEWGDSPHLMTGGEIDGCLVLQSDWASDLSLTLHQGFGYEWEELTPKKMKAIAKEIAYTAKGWLLGQVLLETINNEREATK
jgi:hypothetical protein